MTAQRSYEPAGQITLNLALDDVYQSAATTASQFGGGSLTAQGDRDPVAVEEDLANWYPDLDGLVRERRAPELAGGFTPRSARSTPVGSISTVEFRCAAGRS